jgi:hypothetical protein
VIVPLALAHGVARLLGMIPGLLLVAQIVAAARAKSSEFDLSALVAALDVLSKPETWLLLVQGTLLAALGSWLLTTLIEAGTLKLLGAQAGQTEASNDALFSEGLLEAGPRALVTGAIAALLRWVALLSALGMLAAGVVYFTRHPGVLAAMLMTVATAVLLLVPALVAALETGFARTVIRAEGPVTALGNGLLLAGRRGSALLPAWYFLVFVDLVVLVAMGTASGTIGAFPSPEGIWILLLGPRALVWGLGVVLASSVQLLRLGLYATLVAEDAGSLPKADVTDFPAILPAIAILDAVPVGGPSGEEPPAF